MPWRRRSFDELPALRMGGKPLRAALRTVTAAWMFGVVWMACISGSQMTLLGKLLGFSNRHFGYLSAIAWTAYLGQLISAVVIERTGLRKYQFIFYATIQRLMWLVIAAVPLVLRPGPTAVAVFLSIYAVGALLAHMAMPPWQNWMADMIPRRIRGRYFAARRVWTIPVQIVVTVAAGLILDLATVKAPPEAPLTVATQPYLLPAICGLFAFGAIFGVIDVTLFLRMREIVSEPLLAPRRRPRRHPLIAAAEAVGEAFGSVFQAVRDRGFIYYALYAATIAFAMTVGAQFWWLNSLENLGYSKLGANVVFMVCSPLMALATARLWGGLIDRWGRRPVLILCTAGTFFSPVGWFLIPADGPMWLAYALGAATCMIGGAMWGGVELGRFNVLLGFAESAGRSKYMAAAAVFTAIGGFAGGTFGGWLADHFINLQYNHSPLRVGPFLWNNWHLTFLASMAARLVAVGFLIPMPDPGAKPFRDVIRHIRINAYNNALPRLFWRLRVWRRREPNAPANSAARTSWWNRLWHRRPGRGGQKAA